MLLLRNIVFAILFYIGSTILVIVAAFRTLISRTEAQRGASMWSGYIRWLVEAVLGIRIEIDGKIPDRAVIVASKHESNLETLLLPSLFPWPAVVMKAELMRIPVWGWIARTHGSIPVDRDAQASAMRTMLRAASEAKAEDRQIVIFPEGTRTPPGEAPPLRAGVSGLYRLLKLPVVPVALSSGYVWPKTGLKRPGVMRMRFGEDIPAGLDREDFEARLHSAINEKP
ncbi:MAG: lysophospholipid acyltransferase family protein [Pacificimonas sp.]